MVVGLAADGDVSLPDLDLGDGPLVARRRLRGRRPLPPGRRDLRPARLDPDGQPARVPQRRRRRVRRPLRRRAGAPAPEASDASGPGAALPKITRPGRSAATSARSWPLAVWLVVTLVVGLTIFLQQQPDARARDATTPSSSPTLERLRRAAHRAGAARRTPAVRRRIGVDITLGKTEATSVDELLQRYAVIAASPRARSPRCATRSATWRSRRRCAARLVGLVPLGSGCWSASGAGELFHQARQLRLVEVGPGAGAAPPCCGGSPGQDREAAVAEAPGVDAAGRVPRPRGAAARRGGRPRDARRRHDRPDAAAHRERHLDLRPEQDLLHRRRRGRRPASSCASRTRTRPWSLLVSDRHDNIGMDKVARAIGDAAGATAVLRRRRRHLGRRSVGGVQPRLRRRRPSRTYDRFGVAGNHDHGDLRRAATSRPRLDDARRRGRRRPRRHPAARRRRPALQRPGQLARRDRAVASTEVGDRLADAACDAQTRRRVSTLARARRQPRSPRRSRAAAPTWSSAGTSTSRSARTGWSGENGATGYSLHDGHDRRGGVRHRRRQQAAAPGRRDADDLPRRPADRASRP